MVQGLTSWGRGEGKGREPVMVQGLTSWGRGEGKGASDGTGPYLMG